LAKLEVRGPKVKKTENVGLPRGVYLRGDIYWIRYGVGGKTARESTFGSDLKKANDLLTIRRADVLTGKLSALKTYSKKTTFRQLAEEYRDKVSIKKKSYCTEKLNINIMIGWLGHLKLYLVNQETVEMLQKLVLSEREVKEATANRYVATFKHIMTWGYEKDWINRDVLLEVRKQKMYSEVVPEVVPLTSAECIELVKKAPASIRNAILIGLFTGLRRKDILNMKWENINFDTDTITVIPAKTETTVKEVKPLHFHLGLTLRIFLENTERNGEYIVAKPDGNKFKTIKESWEKARKSIGKDKLRLPDLRHTFASLLVQNGTDIYTISHILGHSSVHMSRRYAHLLPTHHSKETKKLDGIIGFTAEDIAEMREPEQDYRSASAKNLLEIERQANAKRGGH